MAIPRQANSRDSRGLFQGLFAGTLGGLLGLSLLKFGNPVIMDGEIQLPDNLYEWLLTAWPLAMGYGLLVPVGLLGVLVARRRPGTPRWLILAPLPWLLWQVVATIASTDPSSSLPTLIHMAANIVCFYLGLFCLSPVRGLRWFWATLMAGFLLVLFSGWQQHFGGLEATREYFFTEVYPRMEGEISPELLKRMSSDRIFATLFYPNTLAGAILLLAPVGIGVFPAIFRHGPAKRISLMLMLILAGGCLLWSGSKAGWLLMLGLMLVGLFRLGFSRRVKLGVAILMIVAGTAGFAWKYGGYLQKGAQSAVARLDYWEAAVKVAAEHPLRGTGPGTFGDSYAMVKRPKSEMAHLAHNDYLQQASDSGLPGLVFYVAFVAGTMVFLGLRVWESPDPTRFWVWVGLLGITAQSLTEFGLYIPAISWPTMALMGWLLGAVTNHLDNGKRQNLTFHPR